MACSNEWPSFETSPALETALELEYCCIFGRLAVQSLTKVDRIPKENSRWFFKSWNCGGALLPPKGPFLFFFFFPWEGPKNGVSWESYAQLYTSLLINQLFRWWERMTKAAIFCCETCVTRIGKKRVAPSLGRKKKRRKSLQTSRSLVYQMTSSSLARNWMLVGKALFSGVKLRVFALHQEHNTSVTSWFLERNSWGAYE